MISDVSGFWDDSAAPASVAPPAHKIRAPQPSRDEVLGWNETDIEAHIEAYLETAPAPSRPAVAADGTTAINSLIAVAIASHLAEVLGLPTLIDLSKSDRHERRSVGGLTTLIRSALESLPNHDPGLF